MSFILFLSVFFCGFTGVLAFYMLFLTVKDASKKHKIRDLQEEVKSYFDKNVKNFYLHKNSNFGETHENRC